MKEEGSVSGCVPETIAMSSSEVAVVFANIFAKNPRCNLLRAGCDVSNNIQSTGNELRRQHSIYPRVKAVHRGCEKKQNDDYDVIAQKGLCEKECHHSLISVS